MKQYFKIWSQHPELSGSWNQGCMRLSLTTIRATQHVTKEHTPTKKDRTFGGRALYLNCDQNPHDWGLLELKRMISEITAHVPYHLDGDPFYIAYLIKKLKQHNLWNHFPKPQTIIHAYEFCTKNVSYFLKENFSCSIVNLFGSTELGFLFATSGHHTLIPYFDDLKLELLPLHPKDNIFSLIVTSLRNPFMPLIRYKSGDCVETQDGSNEPEKIFRICGREAELHKRTDGRFLSQAHIDDIVSHHSKEIFQYQITTFQSKILFTYTTFNDKPSDSINILTSHLEEKFECPCTCQFKETIAPGGSGKYSWLRVAKN